MSPRRSIENALVATAALLAVACSSAPTAPSTDQTAVPPPAAAPATTAADRSAVAQPAASPATSPIAAAPAAGTPPAPAAPIPPRAPADFDRALNLMRAGNS